MKKIHTLSEKFFITLIIIALTLTGCGEKGDHPLVEKSINFNLEGYIDISDRGLSGRIEDNSDDAVTFIQIQKDGVDYAKGIFNPDVTDVPLDLVGDGIYGIIVHSYKKGTGVGIESSGGNITHSQQYAITNQFELEFLPGFGTHTFEHLRTFTESDSTGFIWSELPELDGYFIETSFDSDTVTDGQAITLEVERRSAGLEIVTTNFAEGAIRFELDYKPSRQDAFYELDHPNDSAYFLMALSNMIDEEIAIDTKIYHVVGGSSDLIYVNTLNYRSNMIKRFEIDVASANPSSAGISVVYSDEIISRGDTVSVGN